MSADRHWTMLGAVGDVVLEAVPVPRRIDTGAEPQGHRGAERSPSESAAFNVASLSTSRLPS